MTTVLVLTALAIFVTMALALVRALKGPSVFDRIVAVNVIGTKTVLIVALITAISGNDDLIEQVQAAPNHVFMPFGDGVKRPWKNRFSHSVEGKQTEMDMAILAGQLEAGLVVEGPPFSVLKDEPPSVRHPVAFRDKLGQLLQFGQIVRRIRKHEVKLRHGPL